MVGRAAPVNSQEFFSNEEVTMKLSAIEPALPAVSIQKSG